MAADGRIIQQWCGIQPTAGKEEGRNGMPDKKGSIYFWLATG